jgi:hypothetical protein
MRRLAVVVVVAVAGCGGAQAQEPKLPRALARQLAAQSDRVATALRAGNGCDAAAAARRLRSEATAAVNAGRVPGALQEPLSSAVNDLVSRTRCVRVPVTPAPAPAPAPPSRDHGKHKGKAKGKHKDENGGGD